MESIIILLLQIIEILLYAIAVYIIGSFITIAIYCKKMHISANDGINWWINTCLYYVQAHFNKNSTIDTLTTAEQVYYPVMQNIVYELLLTNHALFNAAKPTSISSVLSSGAKISETANGYIYNYEILLTSTNNLLDESQSAEILQKELIKKSFDGFPGVTFCNGYPIIWVHEVLYTNNYMKIRLIVLWNEDDRQRYNAYLDQKRQKLTINMEDEVF